MLQQRPFKLSGAGQRQDWQQLGKKPPATKLHLSGRDDRGVYLMWEPILQGLAIHIDYRL